MDLIIVESPAKAKTINKYLGDSYQVLASVGHVRDLSSKTGSVQPENDFALTWESNAKADKYLKAIESAAIKCDSIILATDPDREGEAISWHIYEILRTKAALKTKPFKRVVFHSITKNAVLEAMQHPRDIDNNMVEAYLARRSLDYLVGYSLSPVLWRKLPGARSAGRVQSVALRMICDQENKIEHFVSQDYWSIAAMLAKEKTGISFLAKLVEYAGVKIDKLDIKSQSQADTMKATLQESVFSVASVEAKQVQRSPNAPFTTSTLQQAASTQFGFPASFTMSIAQELYDGIHLGPEATGLITYMRTDSTTIAPEAIAEAKKVITKDYGAEYVPAQPHVYKTKIKNAQEAHEAIRPTSFARHPKDIAAHLEPNQLKIYSLIWVRALASQMASAKIERTTINITAQATNTKALLRSTGSIVSFKGFLSASGIPSGEDEDSLLPVLTVGQHLLAEEIISAAHKTEPPARYSEASLIKKLEELGIGRPSTYASILSTLNDRGYVVTEKRKLLPQAKGRFVTEFLKQFFARYVEYDFTANLEDQLDEVSNGDLQWKVVLANFWKEFNQAIEETSTLRISDIIDHLNEQLDLFLFPAREGEDTRLCPTCQEGKLSLKLSRFGAFIGCTNYPECKYTRQLGSQDSADNTEQNERIIGRDENTGEDIKLLYGRFGPYLQRGEGETLKNAPIPKDCDPSNISLELATALMTLPREIGIYPETGAMISASLGKFGPYLLHNSSYTKLEGADQMFEITLIEAIELIKNPPVSSRAKAPKKILGQHPSYGPISLQSGRFGPYVKAGTINATIPKIYTAEELSLEQAIELIDSKAKK